MARGRDRVKGRGCARRWLWEKEAAVRGPNSLVTLPLALGDAVTPALAVAFVVLVRLRHDVFTASLYFVVGCFLRGFAHCLTHADF